MVSKIIAGRTKDPFIRDKYKAHQDDKREKRAALELQDSRNMTPFGRKKQSTGGSH
jgi:hypothetical protein